MVAVDVPSGLSAQTGHAPGACVVAEVTCTMIALKPGLLADMGRDMCGTIVVAPLAEQTERLVNEADPVAWRVDAEDYVEVIQPPTCAQDKFTRGSVLVVAGSARFPGAAILAPARPPRRCRLRDPVPCLRPLPRSSRRTSEIPRGGAALDPRRHVCLRCARADRRAGQHPRRRGGWPRHAGERRHGDRGRQAAAVECPLVMDADALNCLARLTTGRLDSFPELMRRNAPLILTPHRGELGRLMGLPDTPPDSLTAALEASRRIVWANGGSEFCLVAKGNATACVGVEVALLPKPGPAALATAGSGDVLAGIMGALLAATAAVGDENLPLLCAFGCEVHGYAGSIAAERYGSSGVMAGI